MRRLLRALPLCLAIAAFLPIQVNAQTLFMQGAAEVDRLSEIYTRAGRAFPTTSFPVSKAELSRFADMLAAGANDGIAQELNEYRRTTLKFETDHDSISAIGDANLQYAYRSQNVSFDPGLPTELQVLDFHRLFKDGLPLGGIQLDYARDGGFEIGIYATLEREYFADPFNPTNLPESDRIRAIPLPWRIRTLCGDSSGTTFTPCR